MTDEYLSLLAELVRIPSISTAQDDVQRSAEAFADLLREEGCDDVALLWGDRRPRLSNDADRRGACPSRGNAAVYGYRHVAQDGPTVLVYGHHDVQPVGRLEAWISPPFEPEVRDGRMFGRGTSDDKGGILAYIAATRLGRHCNVKFLIEGEEEIGSPTLGALLEEHAELLRCDYAVLCDTPNFATGTPSLTYRLRGNVVIDVEVRCLERPAHSGKFGGVAPDAVQRLVSLLASLELPSEPDETIDLPFDEESFRRDVGVLAEANLPSRPYERMWATPSLTITGIEATAVAQAGNMINAVARARISLRSVRGDEGQIVLAQLDQPMVSARVISHADPWRADRAHPLFEAARRALRRGFGREPVMTGSGGSIGFVPPFARLLGDTPLLLTGVQDPPCNAHSENESLHLGDWDKAMQSGVRLFAELARLT